MIKVNWKDWRAAKNKRSFIFSSSFNPLRCCSKKSVIQCVPEGMVNPRWRWDGFPSRCGTRCTKWLFKRRQRLSVKGFRSILTCEMHHHRWAVRSNIFPISILPTTDLSRNCRHAKDVVCTLLIKGVDYGIKITICTYFSLLSFNSDLMYCRSKTKSLWNKGWLFWRQVKLVWQWTHLMPKPQKRASSFNGLQKPFVGYYMNLHHELNYCGNIFHSLVMRITQWRFCKNAFLSYMWRVWLWCLPLP